MTGKSTTFVGALFIAFALSRVGRAHAQDTTGGAAVRMMFVNDEWERYARVLQVSGDIPLYPWSVRGFGLSEAERLTPRASHPWSGVPRDLRRTMRRVSMIALPAQVQTIFNSRFAYGYNDGPVWAGRGVTTVLRSGVAAKAGRLSLIFAPVYFRAENTSFQLMPTGLPGPLQFGDPIGDGGIDQPQRFGAKAYQRLDLGNSTIRLDAGPVAIGFSTANEHWGPARDHPMLLGNNAPGFPRVFVGTSRPVNVWAGKVQTRLFWGKLYESQYTYMRTIQPYRFTTGLVATLLPRGVPGLEIGGGRFFHILWSGDAINGKNLTRTFSDILRGSGANRPENQLASVFARWVFPGGLEAYGEFGREDHNANLRDLELEPDHNSGYLLGIQRVLARASDTRTVVRGEVLNTRLSGIQIFRDQGRFYTHGPVGQGHTNLGQVLGSFGGFGGGAATIAFDAYSSGGRRTISWSRIMRAENRSRTTLMASPQQADVMHTLGIDGLRFRGRVAISYELTAVYDLNRNFAGDVFNLRAASGIQYVW